MILFLAVFIPIAILGFLYLFIIETKVLPNWMEYLSQKSGSIWTYGIITITFFLIIKSQQLAEKRLWLLF